MPFVARALLRAKMLHAKMLRAAFGG